MADVGISVQLRGMDSVARGFGKVGADAKDLGGRARDASRGVDSLSNSLRRLQTAIVGIGLVNVARNVVNTALAFEKLDRTLKVATGSSQGAGEAMKFVRTQADRMGLDLRAAAEGFSRIQIAAKGTALEGDTARRIFVGVSEAASVMGLTADETTGALRAIEQMISKGNVSAEELRGQLGERLPGAFQIAARAMGLTVQEMNKLLDQGLLRAEDLLPRFAQELHKTFGGEVPSAAGSAQAAINRFSTAWTDLQLSFAKSGFLDGIVEAMKDLAKTMKDPEFMAAAKSLGEFMGWAAKQTGWLVQKLGEAIEGYRILGRMIADASGVSWLEQNAQFKAPDVRGRESELAASRARAANRAGAGRSSGISADVWGGAGPGAFTNPLAGKADAAAAKAAREEAKRYRDELHEIEQQADDLRHAQERMWGEANALIEGTLTPLEQYTMDLDKLNDLYAGGFITSAEDYNRVLDKMNQELARSSESYRSVENALDGIFDAAIAGGEDFEETLQDIGKQLASDLFKSNIYNPFKDALASTAGSLMGGGEDQTTGLSMIFGDFLKSLGDLFNGDEGLISKLGKLFLGEDGLITSLGKMFGTAWEWLGGLFTSFLTEMGILQAWEIAQRWALSLWEIAERWAIAIFEAAAGFLGFERGGEVTVTRPTLVMVGEKHKAERLRVSPLSGRSQEAGRAGQKMADETGTRQAPSTIVQVMIPQTSILNDLTAGHFARKIGGVVRRENSRYV